MATHVFQFSLDLLGYGRFLRAVHTGDMPIIFRNLSEDTLRHFPGFDGLKRAELRRIATEFGAMYGSFIRHGDPGPRWPRFDLQDATVMWLGEQVEAKPSLLKGEWQTFQDASISVLKTLQHRLVVITRRALNTRRRAFAADNGI